MGRKKGRGSMEAVEERKGGASRRLKAEKRSRSYPEYRKYTKKGGGSMEAEGGERKEGVQWRLMAKGTCMLH